MSLCRFSSSRRRPPRCCAPHRRPTPAPHRQRTGRHVHRAGSSCRSRWSQAPFPPGVSCCYTLRKYSCVSWYRLKVLFKYSMQKVKLLFVWSTCLRNWPTKCKKKKKSLAVLFWVTISLYLLCKKASAYCRWITYTFFEHKSVLFVDFRFKENILYVDILNLKILLKTPQHAWVFFGGYFWGGKLYDY